MVPVSIRALNFTPARIQTLLEEDAESKAAAAMAATGGGDGEGKRREEGVTLCFVDSDSVNLVPVRAGLPNPDELT